MVTIRPIGLFTVYERRAIHNMLNELMDADEDSFVFDTSDMVTIDPYGMGAILLLNGQSARNRQPLTLMLRDSLVGAYLKKYGVLEIVRHQAGSGVSTVYH